MLETDQNTGENGREEHRIRDETGIAVFVPQTGVLSKTRRESLDADDFAEEVVGCEQGVGRKQLSVQEERSVLWVGFEDL